MKKISIKVKITMWYLLLMLIMMAMVLGFIVAISTSVTEQTAMTKISSVVHQNLNQIDITDGKLNMGEEFSFYQSGVYTLVYSKSETLLAGQVPVNFSETGNFQNGQTRVVTSYDEKYYVLDLWRADGWDNGVWVRGIMEVPESWSVVENLILAVAVAMPVFILIATAGGYGIARKAFKPLENIISTADKINEASDLSMRINSDAGNSEFSRLSQTFDKMISRLETSFEAEKQFTADASHELRTPIAVIKGACEYAIKYDETEEERLETLNMIHRQSEKMASIVSQLLSMTRLDQGTEKANFEKTDMSGLVKSICSDQIKGNYTLNVNLKENVTANIDVALITRLVQNLIDNAVKYGKPDGNVTVSLNETQDEITLSVKDDGMGIQKDEQSKIWQRFYQVDTSRSSDSGTGLGLSMVKKIAEIHGGYMSLESEVNKGSEFVLHIPKEKKK